jgi:hypothetical protein
MQLQQNNDSTNFSVPFVRDTLNVSLEVSTVKKVEKDSTAPKKRENINPVFKSKETTEKGIEIVPQIDTVNAYNSVNYPYHLFPSDVPKLDSIQSLVTKQIQQYQSTFNKGQPIDKAAYGSWEWLIICIAISLIGFTRAFNRKRFSEYIQAIFSRNATIQIIRNEKIYGHRVNIFFTIAYFLIMALMGVQLIDVLGFLPKSGQFQLYLYLIGLLVVAFFVKIGLQKILAHILSIGHLANEYIFTITLFNILSLIVVLPNVLIASYSDAPVQKICLGLASGLLIISIGARLLRGIQIGISAQVNMVYLFLYLCTLEILPLIIVFKILFK